MKYCYLFLTLLVFASCRKIMQESEKSKFSDDTVQRIHTLKAERNTTALLPFLKSENDIYRREAALAFASVQENEAFENLILLLRDPSAEVCLQAAYALGQLGNVEAESALITAIEKEKEPKVKAEMLMALGKICKEEGLSFISGYKSEDSVVRAGQSWALYRAGIRKLYSNDGMNLSTAFLDPDNSYETRLAAAHFFARTPGLELTEVFENLQEAALKDKSPFVRMAAVQAMAKVEVEKSQEILRNILSSDYDYRVKINAFRALRHLNAEIDQDLISETIQSAHPLTALACAEFLLAKSSRKDVPFILNLAEQAGDWRVRATLFAAAMRYAIPEEKVNIQEQILALYEKSTSEYEKGLLLKALSEDLKNLELLQSKLILSDNPVLSTYTMEALVDMRKHKEFPEEQKSEYQSTLIKALETGDVALIGLVAGVLREPALDFKEDFTEVDILRHIQKELILPRDIETYNELQQTIEYLTGSEEEKEAPKLVSTKPINWSTIKKIEANTTATINTAKGAVTIQFFTNEAPESVSNFIELAKNGFYENKNFHRVVPNFVVQAGCPRGDGWGSSDATIHSEFAPIHFGEGYIGMASAGKDTEGCQWFITHSPTPHLDGRYTIFAKVTSGMDVVHQLNISDKILNIKVND